MSRQERFRQHVMAGLAHLPGRYDPKLFRAMVDQHGAVGAAKRLLADPRRTSYGFKRLWELNALDASVEYAVCLPWFQPLFTASEIEEAERRLILHEFPIRERVERAAGNPPDWAVDSVLTDEDER